MRPHALRAIMGHINYLQKATSTNGQTERNVSLTGTHRSPFGPILGDKLHCIPLQCRGKNHTQSWRGAYNYRPCALLEKSGADKGTERHTERHLILTGTHWSPSDPSLGDSCIATLNPTPEINTNTKSQKDHRQRDKGTDRRTDGRVDKCMDKHIILPLKGSDLVPWARMHCGQLRSA